MRKRERKDSITFRCPISLVDELDDLVSKYPEKYSDRSDLIIKKIKRANEFDSLMAIYDDPEKRAEFESQLTELAKCKNIEQFMETITDPQRLKDIELYARNQHDKRLTQIRFQVAQR